MNKGHVPPAKAPFRPLSETRAELGESPVWSAADQAIWWVDIEGRQLVRTALDGTETCWDTPEIPGFVQHVGGRVVVGMQTGIFDFDPDRAQFERLVALDAPGQRFNDACMDEAGRIWAGTMDVQNQRDCGVLYLLDPTEWTLSARLDGFRTVNGLARDAGRNRLYVSDSHPVSQTVWTCETGPEGGIVNRQEFARFHDRAGRPDGADLDGQGMYWIAGVGGGKIYRFAPDGSLNTCYRVPVAAPTKLLFLTDPEPAIVMTSKADDGEGGHLHIWRDPPAEFLG